MFSTTMRLVAIAAVFAVAAAETREQSAQILALQDQVKTLEARILLNAKKMKDQLNSRGTPNVAPVIEVIDELVLNVTVLDNTFQKAAGRIDAVDGIVDQKMKDLGTRVATSADKITKDAEATGKTFEAEINGKVTTSLASLDEKIKKAVEDAKKVSEGAVAAVANKLDAHRSMWVGGQLSHTRSGWHDYKFDRVDFDAAAPHFKRASTTRFQALTTGLFRVYSYQLMNGGWCHAHVHLRVNNRMVQQNSHDWIPHTWEPVQMDMTWVIRKNQQFWIRFYSCDWGMHGSSNNNPNAHNRVIVSYEGKVNTDKCTGYACGGMS